MNHHRRAVALIAAATLVGAGMTHPPVSKATDVVCTVNNGAVNGSDSLSGYGGSDNPDGKTGSYSVNNTWHDSTEYEWCSPSHDWFKEKYLRWDASVVTKLKAEDATRTLQVEQDVLPATSYNFAGGKDSDLPWTDFYVADAAEQAIDGYEDVSFGIYHPNRIVAGTNYHAYLQWEQEADGGFLDGSPLLNYVDCKVTYGTNFYTVVNYDIIGRWHKKVANNK